MNLGRDDRCAPSFELVELARLAPVVGVVISSRRRSSLASWRLCSPVDEVLSPPGDYVVVYAADYAVVLDGKIM